jgi:hypothetical protein
MWAFEIGFVRVGDGTKNNEYLKRTSCFRPVQDSVSLYRCLRSIPAKPRSHQQYAKLLLCVEGRRALDVIALTIVSDRQP